MHVNRIKKIQVVDTINIKNEIVQKIKDVIKIALEYEQYFHNERKLGITGEIGEILASFYFDFKLVKDSRNEGFDAIDRNQKRVQIKATRKEPKKGVKADLRAGRTSKFSEHEFDYCLLLLFDQKYKIKEAWRAEFNNLIEIIEKAPNRNPRIKEFIKHAELVEIPEKSIGSNIK